MNDNLFVKLDVTLSLNEWSMLQAMLLNSRVNLYELEIINKIHEGSSFDVAADIDFDLPM